MLIRSLELLPYIKENEKKITEVYYYCLERGCNPTMVQIARSWALHSVETYSRDWHPMSDKTAQEIYKRIKYYV